MRTAARSRRGARATTARRRLRRVVPRDAGRGGQRVLSRLTQRADMPHRGPGVRTLSVVILSAVAIVTMLAFWAGVTPLVAAVAVGVGARAQLSKAARILRPIAVVAAAVTIVVTLVQSSLF